MRQKAHRELVDDERPDLVRGIAADSRAAAHDERGLVQHLALGFLDRDFPREEGRGGQADQKRSDHDQIEFRPEAHGITPCLDAQPPSSAHVVDEFRRLFGSEMARQFGLDLELIATDRCPSFGSENGVYPVGVVSKRGQRHLDLPPVLIGHAVLVHHDLLRRWLR